MFRLILFCAGAILLICSGVLGCVRQKSPSPAHLVFTSRRGNEDGFYRIYADGSGLHRLAALPGGQVGYAGYLPVLSPFSPDGQWVAYASTLEDGFDIYKTRNDGLKVRLTGSPATDFSPAWSPDGKWIAFVSDRAGNFDIYKMHADGTHMQQLTDHPGNDVAPAWLPIISLSWKWWINLAVGFLLLILTGCPTSLCLESSALDRGLKPPACMRFNRK